MKYTCEDNLTNFKFWSGAADRVKDLTYDELDRLDDILPEYFGDEELPSDTDINDMFWFDFSTVCHALGYAYIDGTIVRDVEDVPEGTRLEFLKEFLDENDWKYTDEQLKALDQKLMDDGTYELEPDEDSLKSLYDTLFTDDDAKAVGIITDAED